MIARSVSVILAATVLAACGGPPAPEQTTGAPSQDDGALEHVHGLGVDPADGTLYAASHFGVVRMEDNGEAVRVADRWQDTMAFTVTGPKTFMASGHPDLREDLPSHLGLIESTDAAATWTPVSLAGEADFHALEVAEDTIYGFDSVTGRLLMSQAGREWISIAEAPVIDLAWLGHDANAVLASTQTGLTEYGGDRQAIELTGEPPLLLIDSPDKGTLVGITASGAVYSAADPFDGRWHSHGRVPGNPEALDATPDAWYVATDRGIFKSADQGQEWDLVLTTSGHAR